MGRRVVLFLLRGLHRVDGPDRDELAVVRTAFANFVVRRSTGHHPPSRAFVESFFAMSPAFSLDSLEQP